MIELGFYSGSPAKYGDIEYNTFFVDPEYCLCIKLAAGVVVLMEREGKVYIDTPYTDDIQVTRVDHFELTYG